MLWLALGCLACFYLGFAAHALLSIGPLREAEERAARAELEAAAARERVVWLYRTGLYSETPDGEEAET